MNNSEISSLIQVAGVLYQKEFDKIKPLIQRETQLRNQIRKLDRHVARSNQDELGSAGYHLSGADVLWRGWVSQTRSQLNIELASVLAQKLSALHDLRLAFGREQAIAGIGDTLRRKQKHRQRRSDDPCRST